MSRYKIAIKNRPKKWIPDEIKNEKRHRFINAIDMYKCMSEIGSVWVPIQVDSLIIHYGNFDSEDSVIINASNFHKTKYFIPIPVARNIVSKKVVDITLSKSPKELKKVSNKDYLKESQAVISKWPEWKRQGAGSIEEIEEMYENRRIIPVNMIRGIRE